MSGSSRKTRRTPSASASRASPPPQAPSGRRTSPRKVRPVTGRLARRLAYDRILEPGFRASSLDADQLRHLLADVGARQIPTQATKSDLVRMLDQVIDDTPSDFEVSSGEDSDLDDSAPPGTARQQPLALEDLLSESQGGTGRAASRRQRDPATSPALAPASDSAAKKRPAEDSPDHGSKRRASSRSATAAVAAAAAKEALPASDQEMASASEEALSPEPRASRKRKTTTPANPPGVDSPRKSSHRSTAAPAAGSPALLIPHLVSHSPTPSPGASPADSASRSPPVPTIAAAQKEAVRRAVRASVKEPLSLTERKQAAELRASAFQEGPPSPTRLQAPVSLNLASFLQRSPSMRNGVFLDADSAAAGQGPRDDRRFAGARHNDDDTIASEEMDSASSYTDSRLTSSSSGSSSSDDSDPSASDGPSISDVSDVLDFSETEEEPEQAARATLARPMMPAASPALGPNHPLRDLDSRLQPTPSPISPLVHRHILHPGVHPHGQTPPVAEFSRPIRRTGLPASRADPAPGSSRHLLSPHPDQAARRTPAPSPAAPTPGLSPFSLGHLFSPDRSPAGPARQPMTPSSVTAARPNRLLRLAGLLLALLAALVASLSLYSYLWQLARYESLPYCDSQSPGDLWPPADWRNQSCRPCPSPGAILCAGGWPMQCTRRSQQLVRGGPAVGGHLIGPAASPWLRLIFSMLGSSRWRCVANPNAEHMRTLVRQVLAEAHGQALCKELPPGPDGWPVPVSRLAQLAWQHLHEAEGYIPPVLPVKSHDRAGGYYGRPANGAVNGPASRMSLMHPDTFYLFFEDIVSEARLLPTTLCPRLQLPFNCLQSVAMAAAAFPGSNGGGAGAGAGGGGTGPGTLGGHFYGGEADTSGGSRGPGIDNEQLYFLADPTAAGPRKLLLVPGYTRSSACQARRLARLVGLLAAAALGMSLLWRHWREWGARRDWIDQRTRQTRALLQRQAAKAQSPDTPSTSAVLSIAQLRAAAFGESRHLEETFSLFRPRGWLPAARRMVGLGDWRPAAWLQVVEAIRRDARIREITHRIAGDDHDCWEWIAPLDVDFLALAGDLADGGPASELGPVAASLAGGQPSQPVTAPAQLDGSFRLPSLFLG
ncbi:hypothetical protein H696_01577 [Fonticula alba]|uniref:Man1/Src1-like C-terminal domain-containing protein n=1 Tax=Fonticula alba TaxID=691883 RepID=A0A058ZCN7_FONAL|nr:hypothetical protein H696_01577 [Fonticula alba]KCV72175.1 hypothetical protein H696_01577 [Fonticula alba]|eukprot:XP_009493753.1 hypothetical protein H696_01577 [Fonticula alba]